MRSHKTFVCDPRVAYLIGHRVNIQVTDRCITIVPADT